MHPSRSELNLKRSFEQHLANVLIGERVFVDSPRSEDLTGLTKWYRLELGTFRVAPRGYCHFTLSAVTKDDQGGYGLAALSDKVGDLLGDTFTLYDASDLLHPIAVGKVLIRKCVGLGIVEAGNTKIQPHSIDLEWNILD